MERLFQEGFLRNFFLYTFQQMYRTTRLNKQDAHYVQKFDL